VLRTSHFLVAFLQESNQETYNTKLLSIEMDKGPKNIFDFKTLTGEIEVERRERASKFCDQLKPFAEQYERINTL